MFHFRDFFPTKLVSGTCDDLSIQMLRSSPPLRPIVFTTTPPCFEFVFVLSDEQMENWRTMHHLQWHDYGRYIYNSITIFRWIPYFNEHARCVVLPWRNVRSLSIMMQMTWNRGIVPVTQVGANARLGRGKERKKKTMFGSCLVFSGTTPPAKRHGPRHGTGMRFIFWRRYRMSEESLDFDLIHVSSSGGRCESMIRFKWKKELETINMHIH